MTMFTSTESKVLNRIQRDIPLVERPFREIADEMGLQEDAVIGTIGDLKRRRSVRNIAGIFEPSGLGYSTTLVALQVPEDRIEGAAALINSHPGVSHNYLRDHRYNLWFTLAEEREDLLGETVRFIVEKAGATDALNFRNEKQYKIGLRLNVGDDDGDNVGLMVPARSRPDHRPFSAAERDAILLLQRDLPLDREPFSRLVSESRDGLTPGALLAIGDEMKQTGYMRRYSAVIRPAHTGFSANAMTVWRPSATDSIDRVAELFSREGAITHIYRRTVHPGRWEYPLFAMIHARGDGELAGIVERLARESGVGDHLVLTTLRELKKEKVIYFSPLFKQWNDRETIQ
jgi:siroheme decarboxylase